MKYKLHIFIFALLIILWSVSMAPLLNWFVLGLGSHFDFLQTVIFIAIAGLWLQKGFLSFRFPSKGFIINKAAIFFGILAFGLFLFLKNQSNIKIITFTTGASVLYALTSLIIKPSSWRKGLLPFALLIMTLPFGRHLDMLIGYPLRMFAVDLSYSLLSPFYEGLTSNATILMIENRASHVDMDCSGLRGLWVGSIFILSITWIENSLWNFRWIAAVITIISVILFGNIVRIIALVTVQLNTDLQFIDPFIHHSTSIFFLLLGCLLSYRILQNNSDKNELTEEPWRTSSSNYSFIIPVILLVIMISVPYFEAKPPSENRHKELKLAITERGWKPVKLTEKESYSFVREGVDAVKFEKDNIQLVMVLGGDWRSQHIPELCYEYAGLTLTETTTLLIDPEHPIKQLLFNNRPEQAFYWFQHGSMITDDYATKFWSQIFKYEDHWTQVSLLTANGIIPLHEIKQLQTLISSQL